MPKAIEAMNGKFSTMAGETVQRLETYVYNLEDPHSMKEFLYQDEVKIKVPFSSQTIQYSPIKKIGVGISRLGTSKAVAVGAFAFANNKVNN